MFERKQDREDRKAKQRMTLGQSGWKTKTQEGGLPESRQSEGVCLERTDGIQCSSQPDVESWIREYGDGLLRLIYLYVGDYHTAEDIFQEVFWRAYRSYGNFRGGSSIRTWLTRIAINASKDYLKSAWKRHVEPISEETEQHLAAADEYEKLETELDAQAEAERVRAAVESLPEEYREVVLCFYYEEFSLEETADALGIPTGTVKSRLSRAKERLKKQLDGLDAGQAVKRTENVRRKKG